MLTIQLDPETESHLRYLASQRGTPLESIVAELVAREAQRREDEEDLTDAQSARADWQKNGGTPWEELRAELALHGEA